MVVMSTPVRDLKSSAARCDTLASELTPMASLPGLAFASAIMLLRSGAFVAGPAITNIGTVATSETGARSFSVSNGIAMTAGLIDRPE